MLINKKGIFKNSFIIYTRLLLSIVIAIYTSRLLLKGLGVDNFGLYNVVTGVVAALGIFNSIMITASNRFIATEIGRNIGLAEISRVFRASFSIHLFIAVFLLFAGKFVGYIWIKYYLNLGVSNIETAHFIFNTSLIILFFSIISVPFSALLTAKEDYQYQANISLLQTILLFLAAVSINQFGLNLRYFALLACVINILCSSSIVVFCKNKYIETDLKVCWDVELFRSMIGYSGWMSIGAFSYMFKNQGNAVLVNSFFGTGFNASFALASQIYNQVNNLTTTLNRVFTPLIMRSHGEGNIEKKIELGFLSSRYLFIVACMLGFPIIIFTPEVLSIWLGTIPPFTVILIRLMLLDLILSMSNNGISNMIFASGNVRKYQIQTNLVTLLSLPLTYVFYLEGYQVQYAIITSLLCTFFVNQSKMRFARKMFGLKFKDLFSKVYKYQLSVLFLFIVIGFFVSHYKAYFIGEYFYLKISLMLIVTYSVTLYAGMTRQEVLIFKRKINERF